MTDHRAAAAQHLREAINPRTTENPDREIALGNGHALLAIEARLGQLVELGSIVDAEILEDPAPALLTPQQLSNLRVGSIVLDADGDSWQLSRSAGLWSSNGIRPPAPRPWAELNRSFGPMRLVHSA
ncbi:hypothetical protein SAMN04515671_2941 [Nakamurella panacisegetis]|uniref:Uncharacterized protein n=1 Tax=Nakamurella panacisegetis TaxID=1090615 RepID=A0A1H0Q0T9_9ACTN|nr:hypothetical protein [Nakamurella panacisegetis]SDP10298.1 hypothetical protein SAMN04515671_2941 [Nakamurella panacisegetis]